MAEVKWVKLTTDMFDNRKIKHLRRLPEGNNIVLIWVMLLTMAGRCNSGGMIFLTENIPYTPKMLADELDFEENTVLLALDALEKLDMIVTENGVFTIAGWEEYQNADKLAEMRAKDRERKRLKRAQAKALLGESEDVHGNSTDCPHIEEEKEKDKEKEYHSFNHSIAREEEAFIQKRIEEAGFEGRDAEVYREEIKDNLRLKYMEGTLGQGVVLMSEEQFGDLCEKLSLDEIDKYMGIIVDCENNGKKYKKKSHYQAILDMAQTDRRISK
ncbi:MAG: phage replisome organizer N-terminal domain-containing protein [Clostridia bacterium]|nr:phage replisome organizer N-terminal domain-containing protein [Clostridia bacterium]